jgi:hypothetical protein
MAPASSLRWARTRAGPGAPCCRGKAGPWGDAAAATEGRRRRGLRDWRMARARLGFGARPCIHADAGTVARPSVIAAFVLPRRVRKPCEHLMCDTDQPVSAEHWPSPVRLLPTACGGRSPYARSSRHHPGHRKGALPSQACSWFWGPAASLGPARRPLVAFRHRRRSEARRRLRDGCLL